MHAFVPKPQGTCDVCNRPFEYRPNPNWQAIQHLYKMNPGLGYWLPDEHPGCNAMLDQRQKEAKETQTRLNSLDQTRRAMNELGFPKLSERPADRFHVQPGNEQPFKALQAWTYNETGILLFGEPGRGKSHLMAAFAKKWTEMGMTVAFQSMSQLLAMLRRGFDDDLFDERLRLVSSQARIVILDDLGTEKASEWAEEKLYMIIDTRLNAKLPLFVTTNFTEGGLAERYHPRILSRLKEMCTWFHVEGPDWREKINASRTPKFSGHEGNRLAWKTPLEEPRCENSSSARKP